MIDVEDGVRPCHSKPVEERFKRLEIKRSAKVTETW
jgi:hypothetical protein